MNKKMQEVVFTIASAAVLSISMVGDGHAQQSNVVGKWSCETTNPNGTVQQDEFVFGPVDEFDSNGAGTAMRGIYQDKGSAIGVLVTRVAQGGKVVEANALIALYVKTLDRQNFVFDSVIQKSGSKRTSRCKRK